MQIFLSHGSNQQLLARELARRCPAALGIRLYEINGEADGATAPYKDDAWSGNAGYRITVVDEQALTSRWFDRQLEAILPRERRQGQTLLLPVALSPRACDAVSDKLGRDREFVRCFDQQDASIERAAREITNAVVQRLIDAGEASRVADTGPGAYASAESAILNAAQILKAAIYPFRKSSPGRVSALFERVRAAAPDIFADEAELRRALLDLTRQGRMDGYYFDGEVAFLVKERFQDKTSMNVALKHRLAKAAAALVGDDQVIGMDGGTTILAVARELCAQLSAGSLFGLRVVTNSIPVAQAFLETLALKNAGDRDFACQVQMLGGLCRVSTLCTTNAEDRVSSLVRQMEHMDVAFIGASGIVGSEAFGVTNKPEIAAKKAFQEAAARVVMVCDHTKFSVEQSKPTNPAEAKMTVVTDAPSQTRLEELKRANAGWEQVKVVICD